MIFWAISAVAYVTLFIGMISVVIRVFDSVFNTTEQIYEPPIYSKSKGERKIEYEEVKVIVKSQCNQTRELW